MRTTSRGVRLLFVSLVALRAAAMYAQVDTATLRPVGYHPNAVTYYTAPYFANALFHGGEWLEFSGTEFGTPVDYQTSFG